MGTIREAEQQCYTYDQGRPDGKDPENDSPKIFSFEVMSNISCIKQSYWILVT